jgi:hypothetical protein
MQLIQIQSKINNRNVCVYAAIDFNLKLVCGSQILIAYLYRYAWNTKRFRRLSVTSSEAMKLQTIGTKYNSVTTGTLSKDLIINLT